MQFQQIHSPAETNNAAWHRHKKTIQEKFADLFSVRRRPARTAQNKQMTSPSVKQVEPFDF